MSHQKLSYYQESENVLPAAIHAMPSSESGSNTNVIGISGDTTRKSFVQTPISYDIVLARRQKVISISRRIDPFRWGNVWTGSRRNPEQDYDSCRPW